MFLGECIPQLHDIKGECKSVREFAEQYGIKLKTVWNRIYSGWTLEQALITPVYKNRKKTRFMK